MITVYTVVGHPDLGEFDTPEAARAQAWSVTPAGGECPQIAEQEVEESMGSMYIAFCESPRFKVTVYRSVPIWGPNRGVPTKWWIMNVRDKRNADTLTDGRHTSEQEAQQHARDFLESAEIAPDSMKLSELSDVLNGG